MTEVKFWSGESGEFLGRFSLDTIPRKDDIVLAGGVQYIVLNVAWTPEGREESVLEPGVVLYPFRPEYRFLLG